MLKRRLKEPFGKAGLMVAILALVVGMAGGAYAAGGLSKAQEKQVTKIAKKYAGKPGATGPAGAAGKEGAKGANGTSGSPGANGSNGAPGESVTIAESANAFGSHCTGTGATGKGGTKLKVGATETFACNGKEGTFGGSALPSGKSLTGIWAASGFGEVGFPTAGFGGATTGVSYALPVGTTAPTANYIAHGEPVPSGCGGTAAEPEAKPGNLCVFAESELNATDSQVSTSAVSGFQVSGFTAAKGTIILSGTWAVTAAE